MMTTARLCTALALVSLSAAAVGCSAEAPSERKGNSQSHIERSEDESTEAAGEGDGALDIENEALAENGAESDRTSDDLGAEGEEHAALPLVVIGVFALGLAACVTHNYLCTQAARAECGGKATVVSACGGNVSTEGVSIEVKCEISCPVSAG